MKLTGVRAEDLEKVVLDSGLWEQEVRGKHDFLLSPDNFEVNEEQLKELHVLSKSVQSCLAGIGRIAAIAFRTELGHSRTWRRLKSTFGIGVPNYYIGLEQINPSRTPFVCKVDCLLGKDGKLYIVEIDAHNKHGMGYCDLAYRLGEASRLFPTSPSSPFPGIAKSLAEEVLRRGESSLGVVLAPQEVFYLPETRIIMNSVRTHGVSTNIVMDQRSSYYYSSTLKGEDLPNGLYVDFPFVFHNKTLVENLVSRYKAGEVQFLIPPKPFLGSKALLALLRNDTEDREWEAILQSQIPGEDLVRVREFIPETYLLSKDSGVRVKDVTREGGFLLKRCVSSGMKGVVFSSDVGFANALKEAQQGYYQFILQREVENMEVPLECFDKSGSYHTAFWQCRLTLFASVKGAVDAVVTARRDKRVHGALDCILVGIRKSS